MKHIAITVFALIATAGIAEARSIHSGISMSTFKSRCEAAGGEVSAHGSGFLCILPSGAAVTCYDTDGPGIDCDVHSGRTTRPLKNLLGTLTINRNDSHGSNSAGGDTPAGNAGSASQGGGNGCAGQVC